LFLNYIGIDKENLLMIFLVGVLISTVATKGYQYGFLTAIICVYLFNYFFTEPYHSFVITNQQDILLILFFLIAALICGMMSSKFQHQAEKAKHNEKTAQLMYEITESFLNLTGTENIVNNALKYIYEQTGYSCMVTLDKNKFEGCQTFFRIPNNDTEYDWASGYKLPIKGLMNQMGTITFQSAEPFSRDTGKVINTIVYQMALILDREYIYLEREKIKLAMKSEHLKSTLLRSISHDIRTPLTGIIGASNVIMEHINTLTDTEIQKLASDINEESAWLVMTVQNILDMTRISDGKLTITKEYESVDDLINQAVSRLPSFYDLNRLITSIPQNIFLVHVDGKLFVQVLVNLIDNAFKHSGDTSQITLTAYPEDEQMVFLVSDNGIGIDPSILGNIFNGFVTKPTHTADKGRGVGLGLSICKAIVTAHAGTIEASNNKSGGSSFKITMPYEQE
jgi:two-component system sensor histidine kinase KdpD